MTSHNDLTLDLSEIITISRQVLLIELINYIDKLTYTLYRNRKTRNFDYRHKENQLKKFDPS